MTTRLKVVVRVTPPPAAWIVIVVVDAGAGVEAVRVTAAEHDGLQLVVVNALAVTPIGRGVVMLNVTGVVTPDTNVADAVSTPPALPVTIVRVSGVAARLKSNGTAGEIPERGFPMALGGRVRAVNSTKAIRTKLRSILLNREDQTDADAGQGFSENLCFSKACNFYPPLKESLSAVEEETS